MHEPLQEHKEQTITWVTLLHVTDIRSRNLSLWISDFSRPQEPDVLMQGRRNSLRKQ